MDGHDMPQVNAYNNPSSSVDKVMHSLIFSLRNANSSGSLIKNLEIIKNHNISLNRIESRPSKTPLFDYDFFVDFEIMQDNKEEVTKMITELRANGAAIIDLGDSKAGVSSTFVWFPRKISDLDQFAHKVLEYGQELSSDHPGFTDPEYRIRRMQICSIAANYRYGQSIPRIEYTDQEKATWRVVYQKLRSLFRIHACKQHNYVFPLLEQNCGYSEDNIPQLEDVSRFLKECTGWSLRPVSGLLSPRDFLNGLAFRVFHSTQYIRHYSKPLYTPEPDVCHELLGHVPLYADPDFADFSQEIGLASLGASDDDIVKLATLYWFTVEFGLCKEDGTVKAYGAGLLSSFGELEYCISDQPKLLPFDPFVTARTPYPITSYQPLYFVAESFQDMKEKLRSYVEQMQRPFIMRYNPYTQSVEILDTHDKVVEFAHYIKTQMGTLTSALEKVRIST